MGNAVENEPLGKFDDARLLKLLIPPVGNFLRHLLQNCSRRSLRECTGYKMPGLIHVAEVMPAS